MLLRASPTRAMMLSAARIFRTTARTVAAARHVTPFRILPTFSSRYAHSSCASSSSTHSAAPSPTSSPPPAPLLPSQAYIVLPQLSPRMEHGSVLQWLVREGDELAPHQVFLHVQTRELTEDGQPYVLEVESHERGIVRRILSPASEDPLNVGTPIALFEDPEWTEGDPKRGEFLWQAYVKEGAVRSGSCAPQRTDSDSSAAAPSSASAPPSSSPTPKSKGGRKKKAT